MCLIKMSVYLAWQLPRFKPAMLVKVQRLSLLGEVLRGSLMLLLLLTHDLL